MKSELLYASRSAGWPGTTVLPTRPSWQILAELLAVDSPYVPGQLALVSYRSSSSRHAALDA
jgi:hypothetical protein